MTETTGTETKPTPSRGWISWALLGVGALALFGFLVAKETGAISKGTVFTEMIEGSNMFVMIPDPSQTADQWLDLARGQCGSKPQCSVFAWATAAEAAKSFPFSPAQDDAIMFAFNRDFGKQDEMALWDCRRFKRDKQSECLPSAPSPQ